MRQSGAGVVLIAGPTASGKSRLALELAATRGGVVINADSMQVYRELRIISARPSAEDEAAVPHLLYGHVGAATRYSVGTWLADIAPVLADAKREGRVAIVVGGTGLYFKALTEGLASVPPIPADVRLAIARRIAEVETGELHARLAGENAEDAAAIRPTDRSRIVRAMEVFATTGLSLAAWKRADAQPPLVDPQTLERLLVIPEQAELHRRIAARAEAMVHHGSIEEARALGSLGLDPAQPAMKAIGVRELLAHLAGKLSLDEAVAAIKTETRRYAKRQMTWIRNQMADWPRP
ncbi:MAG TPA: tRNA (adenosine(37)-N6)-dimethylallyltransferase MiaA [Bauldia sp.]|nr:tRNA (adenosine(37)-N6)-dimethylallyltransferase MiaA [Bauldia sp.]